MDCLLLAVAGATSLVTLLLAVPITVLAVLAFVPQEQGGLVSGYNKSPRRLYIADAHLPLSVPGSLLASSCSAGLAVPGRDVLSVSLPALFPHSCDTVVS